MITVLYKTLILDEERKELVFLEENVLIVHCLRKKQCHKAIR